MRRTLSLHVVFTLAFANSSSAQYTVEAGRVRHLRFTRVGAEP